MKHFVLYIAAVTALQLLRGSESSTRLLGANAKPKAQLSLVSQYLKGSISRTQLVEAAEKATSTMQWQDAVTDLKHHLPKDIVSMLKAVQSKKHPKQPFDEAPLDKSR